ncbi:hypothetical protein CIY_01980 [Butyrivibrio fibrisolvens 16/4]|nr:hypothetical protein CIY_01980 [Butyrivibrio fibrisolvens 16/4]
MGLFDKKKRKKMLQLQILT